MSKQTLQEMINLERVHDRNYDKMHDIITRCADHVQNYDWRIDVERSEWIFQYQEYFDYIFWRWEFLRRNNFYRLTWLYYTTLFPPSYWSDNPSKSANFDRFVIEVFGLKKISDPRFDFEEFDTLKGGVNYKYFGLSEDILQNWPVFIDQNSDDIVVRDASRLRQIAEYSNNTVFVPIDLTLSINMQLSRAKIHLKSALIKSKSIKKNVKENR